MLVKIILIVDPIPYGSEPPKPYVDEFGDLVLFDYTEDFLPPSGDLFIPSSVIEIEQRRAF